MATAENKITPTSINLLGTTSRVSTPSIGLKIDKYIFGVYSTIQSSSDNKDYYIINNNYVKSLEIQKINGTVNKYTLVITYPVLYGTDPNYIDKIFSKISKGRTIWLSYGDLSTPSFVYREEEAIVTKVKRRTNVSSAVKSYTISAISKGVLNTLGTYRFSERYAKPSQVIKEILYSPKYRLTDVFTGMSNEEIVRINKLIPEDDAFVKIESKINITILDYLNYLVNMMTPQSSKDRLMKDYIYLLVFCDDISGPMNGPYFKIEKSSHMKSQSTAYEINVGYPSQNIVTDWQVEDDETYALYYEFAEESQSQSFGKRIDDKGNMYDVYSVPFANNMTTLRTVEDVKTWWTKVTQFPIKASITFRGLLRPAVLMSYVRINIYFYGQKDMDSGLYLIKSQVDRIDESGFKTTLGLVRVGGDDTYDN